MKNGDVGMANRFSNKYGNKGLPFNYLRNKRCLSAPDATYIPTSLPQEPFSILYYLTLNSGIGHFKRTVVSLG